MSRPSWSPNLTDLAAISATSAAYHQSHPPAGGPTWEAEHANDAFPRTLSTSQHVSGDGERDVGTYMNGSVASPDGLANYHAAPEAYLPRAVHPAEPIMEFHKLTHHVPDDGTSFPPEYNASIATFSVASPSAPSDHVTMYSPSSSDESVSQYPSPGPQAFTALANSANYVAQPLLSTAADYYASYFANPEENLCLFSDMVAQFDEDPISPTSSGSPAPTTPSAIPSHIAPNYSGPIRNHIVNMSTDKNGVVWIVFPYSKNKQVKNHTIRCDVEKVPPSALRTEIKQVSAAAYPMVGGIILGSRNFAEYTGKRFAYEWDCCWLGWSLAQLNPTLLEQKGLLQRATDNVASFVFEGCMSRTKLKTHRNEKHKARDSALPLHEWHDHMLPRPKWLPGLDQAKHEKDRLKKLYQETRDVYYKIARDDKENDGATIAAASNAAVAYYSEHVYGAALTPTKEADSKPQEATPKRDGPSSAMNYINIPADPHIDVKDSLRVNVLIDRVKENVISDSCRLEGAVFLDVFDMLGTADEDLKAKVDGKKSSLEYYRNNNIGLVRPTEENIPSLAELIQKCNLNIDEYNRNWRDFKIEVNGIGFKIKFLDTNNRHQKITDPLLMQRVLHEILRRACDIDRPRKRKADPPTDGKYAENLYDRENRSARPGQLDFTGTKRRRVEDFHSSVVARKRFAAPVF